jgi:hypothetical protein
MRTFILFILSSTLFISCSTENSNNQELDVEEKEVALQEPEIDSNEKIEDNPNSVTIEEVDYKSYSPCTFSIDLPSNFHMRTMFDDKSSDYCDYVVSTGSGSEVMELHSLLNSRFEFTEVKELYHAAVQNSELQITYKTQKDNWFVISGTKRNGNIVYWKRISGDSFISDLHIEYPSSRKSEIEPYIGRISNSFKSQ